MKRVCSQPDCGEPAYARGLCRNDYRRAWLAKTLAEHPRVLAEPRDLCAVDGCGRKHYAKRWCKGHYERWRLRGDAQPDVPLAPPAGYRGVRRPLEPSRSFDLADTNEL